MNTRLTELLGCRYPIIQTAMGWVADAKLVAATGEAGGFGFLAGAVMTPAEIEQGIREIKALTNAPFGVNFHMYVPHAEQIVDLCIEHQVRAVSYSRSPSPATVDKLKAAGIVCIPTVGAKRHAVKAVEMGADAVVIQGGEGGGHTGSLQPRFWCPRCAMRLMCLLPLQAAFATVAVLLRPWPWARTVLRWARAFCLRSNHLCLRQPSRFTLAHRRRKLSSAQARRLTTADDRQFIPR